ncbi:hypothetical protein RJZ56_001155 [Blastomyces dermatitidis]
MDNRVELSGLDLRNTVRISSSVMNRGPSCLQDMHSPLNDRDPGVMTDLDDALSTERDQAILANCDSIMMSLSTGRGNSGEPSRYFEVPQNDQFET